MVSVDDWLEAGGEQQSWQDWAQDAGATLHLIHGHSHDLAVVEAARRLGPYEFAVIDAEHTYEAVKGDWDSYSPMVAPGGVVAFHDIKPRPGYGVHALWEEIRTAPGARTVEFWQRSPYYANGLSGHDHGHTGEAPYDPGIGVVWL